MNFYRYLWFFRCTTSTLVGWNRNVWPWSLKTRPAHPAVFCSWELVPKPLPKKKEEKGSPFFDLDLSSLGAALEERTCNSKNPGYNICEICIHPQAEKKWWEQRRKKRCNQKRWTVQLIAVAATLLHKRRCLSQEKNGCSQEQDKGCRHKETITKRMNRIEYSEYKHWTVQVYCIVNWLSVG